MGMIEDLETATLWLSSVTVRLVRSSEFECRKDADPGESKGSKQKRKRSVGSYVSLIDSWNWYCDRSPGISSCSRSRRVTTRYTIDDSGDEVVAGVCEDICITRDKVTAPTIGFHHCTLLISGLTS
jgi:hypothetical protein